MPARYLDVLILLVSAEGALVTKDRFMDEVWRGVPVTDEALTQAIRTLRKALGDSVSAPRFIETVPKHGYRFIAPISQSAAAAEAPVPPTALIRDGVFRQTSAGIVGALLAGGLVGLLYGFVGAAQTTSGGAVSLLLVIILVSALSAGAAGAGIAAGITLSRAIRPQGWEWRMAGGALGGVTLGALANMVGKDAFRLLFGHVVGPITGAMEGFVVGAAAGLASFLVHQQIRYAPTLAAFLGAASGLIVVLLDGRMMAGSLQTWLRASSMLTWATVSGVRGSHVSRWSTIAPAETREVANSGASIPFTECAGQIWRLPGCTMPLLARTLRPSVCGSRRRPASGSIGSPLIGRCGWRHAMTAFHQRVSATPRDNLAASPDTRSKLASATGLCRPVCGSSLMGFCLPKAASSRTHQMLRQVGGPGTDPLT